MAVYSVDTNIYLDWWERRYPSDIFLSLTAQVEGLIGAGRWRAVKGVSDEIVHNGTPALKSWAKANPGQFVAHDAAVLKEANAILARFSGMIDPYARHDEADRYIIAHAKLNGWTVVTHETPARSKKHAVRSHFIPDVCSNLGVRCIGLLELMREQKWTFR